jgi:hypothetical protein
MGGGCTAYNRDVIYTVTEMTFFILRKNCEYKKGTGNVYAALIAERGFSTAVTVILLMSSIADERDYLERMFIYMTCKFQLVWLTHMRITVILVKLLLPWCRKFQNGTKCSD